MFIQSYIFPLKRWSSCFSKGDSAGGSEEGGGVFLVKAMKRLSGLKIGMPPTPGIWKAFASFGATSMRRNQMSPSTPWDLRSERKASSLPSGLQLGDDELRASLVSLLAGAEPSVGLIQSS